MFCWSCGHENADNNKFCGECGKSLFKPEQTVQNITTAKNFSRAEQKPSPEIKSGAGDAARSEALKSSSGPSAPSAGTVETTVSSAAREIPKQTNPLIEEPRVVHERPVPAGVRSTLENKDAAANVSLAPPTPIRERIPNRITGPSFLGLSDDPSAARNEESSYLLDDEAESSSPWRGYVMLAVLVVLSLLIIRNWQALRTMATDYSERVGNSDPAKRSAAPERVTASNDASQITPDAEQGEGRSSTPGEKSPQDSTKPQQSAKLDKPQSDNAPADSAGRETADKASSSEDDGNPTASKAAPTPSYDNSQLEEAQKYLQGRGVPQDCNRGIDLLRGAAKQPNPKARIQMAALYVSGHCVTQDLTQAYTWFSRAKELDPRNRMIERNLDSLWARMTDEERRKVLR